MVNPPKDRGTDGQWTIKIDYIISSNRYFISNTSVINALIFSLFDGFG